MRFPRVRVHHGELFSVNSSFSPESILSASQLFVTQQYLTLSDGLSLEQFVTACLA